MTALPPPRAVYTTVAARPGHSFVPYRWRGTPGWDPASAVPPRKPRPGPGRGHRGATPEQVARSRERQVEFARLREQGRSLASCARALGVGTSTVQKYEQARKAAL